MRLSELDKTTRFRIFLILAIAVVAAAKLHERRNDLTILYHQRFTDPRTIREYFETHSIRKLQLGAGGHTVAGWLNTDIEPKANEVYLDATSDYPFPSGSFHYVFAEHLIEHLPWEGGLKMLKECHRVLAPGGKIRIVTPNLVKSFQLINDSAGVEVRKVTEASRRLFDWPDTPVMAAYVFNKTMREWGHQFIYDPATLRKTFELAGFTEIKERRMGEKTDPIFEGVEFRTRSLGEDMWLTNSWGALAFEAVR
jgi:predicted SAM-dependent methyltransferase